MKPLLEVFKEYRRMADEVLQNSELLKGLDLSKEEDAEEAMRRIPRNAESPESCALLIGAMIDHYHDCASKNDVPAKPIDGVSGNLFRASGYRSCRVKMRAARREHQK